MQNSQITDFQCSCTKIELGDTILAYRSNFKKYYKKDIWDRNLIFLTIFIISLVLYGKNKLELERLRKSGLHGGGSFHPSPMVILRTKNGMVEEGLMCQQGDSWPPTWTKYNPDFTKIYLGCLQITFLMLRCCVFQKSIYTKNGMGVLGILSH